MAQGSEIVHRQHSKYLPSLFNEGRGASGNVISSSGKFSGYLWAVIRGDGQNRARNGTAAYQIASRRENHMRLRNRGMLMDQIFIPTYMSGKEQ
jgi:hypothetical protein